MGEAIYMMGRQKNPTKTQTFFAPMDVAAAALSHRGVNFAQHNIAIPHALKLYQKRFLEKDHVENPDGFKCIQASLTSDGLLVRNYHEGQSFLAFVLDAHDEYIKAEYRKSLAPTTPTKTIKFKTRHQFLAALKLVFSFCHYYVSYHPFGYQNRAEAYEKCQEFYNAHWSIFLQEYAHLPDRPKDKFSAFKQLLHYKGVQNWYDLKLWDAKISHVTRRKGDMGGYLLKDENRVLDLIEGYLVSHELTAFLPEFKSSKDFLSCIQDWLRHEDTKQSDKDRFDWLKEVELSEEFYNEELRPLHLLLMAEHDEIMKEKAKKAEEVKKHNEFCQQVLAYTPMWTTVNSLLDRKRRAEEEDEYQKYWDTAWKPLPTDLNSGALEWELLEGSRFPQAKRARWTKAKVPKTEHGYATNLQEIMEKHVRHQYLFKLEAMDPDHIFQTRKAYWEKWWAEFNAWDKQRHEERTHNWNGEWRLDGKQANSKGDMDSQNRQKLWDCLKDDVPLSATDKMIVPGEDGELFVRTNVRTIFKLRELVEMLYHTKKFKAPSYNDPDLLDGPSELGGQAAYVAIKLGFLRRDWGREHRGDAFGDHTAAIKESLSEWVVTFLLRDLNILLMSFYECCVQHSPTVKRAIFDFLRGEFEHLNKNPHWENRIIRKVAMEIYSERGETAIPNYGRINYKRTEVPVSASYEAAAPEIDANPSKETEKWLDELTTEWPVADHGYWDPKGPEGLNPKEAARSALLWSRFRTKIGLNDVGDSDYSDVESEDEGNDERHLINGRWTLEDVFNCTPKISGKDKSGRDKWVGVVV